MPLLETTQTNYVNASVRFSDSTARLVDQYVAFLRANGQPRATADEVLAQSAGYTFNKDREFQDYLKTQQAANVPSSLRIRKAAVAGGVESTSKKPAAVTQAPAQTPAVVAGSKA